MLFGRSCSCQLCSYHGWLVMFGWACFASMLGWACSSGHAPLGMLPLVVGSCGHLQLSTDPNTDILQRSSIAWPNAAMWQQPHLVQSLPVPMYFSGGSDPHAHSPRPKISELRDSPPKYSHNAFGTLAGIPGMRRVAQPARPRAWIRPACGSCRCTQAPRPSIRRGPRRHRACRA